MTVFEYIQTRLVTERIHWHTERPCQPEITNLEFSPLVDQQVLRLEISVQDTVVMAERDTL